MEMEAKVVKITLQLPQIMDLVGVEAKRVLERMVQMVVVLLDLRHSKDMMVVMVI